MMESVSLWSLWTDLVLALVAVVFTGEGGLTGAGPALVAARLAVVETARVRLTARQGRSEGQWTGGELGSNLQWEHRALARLLTSRGLPEDGENWGRVPPSWVGLGSDVNTGNQMTPKAWNISSLVRKLSEPSWLTELFILTSPGGQCWTTKTWRGTRGLLVSALRNFPTLPVLGPPSPTQSGIFLHWTQVLISK